MSSSVLRRLLFVVAFICLYGCVETTGNGESASSLVQEWPEDQAIVATFFPDLDDLGPISTSYDAVHVFPDGVAALRNTKLKAIVDLRWFLFDEGYRVHPEIESNLNILETILANDMSRIVAFYIVDEPYLNEHGLANWRIEKAIATLRQRALFRDIPTYAVFALRCFDPTFTHQACSVLPASERSVPPSIDWVGFDWYTGPGTCFRGDFNISCDIRPTLLRLKELAGNRRLFLVPESTTQFRSEGEVIQLAHFYHRLANEFDMSIDTFLWKTTHDPKFGGVPGLQSSPAAAINQLALNHARQSETRNEVKRGLIPIFESFSAGDFDYGPALSTWQYPSQIRGAAFATVNSTGVDRTTLYRCEIARGAFTDSYLTTSRDCDGAPLRAAPRALGQIFTRHVPYSVPLYRFGARIAPWEHAVSINPSAHPPSTHARILIGWVYPPSAF